MSNKWCSLNDKNVIRCNNDNIQTGLQKYRLYDSDEVDDYDQNKISFFNSYGDNYCYVDANKIYCNSADKGNASDFELIEVG